MRILLRKTRGREDSDIAQLRRVLYLTTIRDVADAAASGRYHGVRASESSHRFDDTRLIGADNLYAARLYAATSKLRYDGEVTRSAHATALDA